jgi:hypothetical protein
MFVLLLAEASTLDTTRFLRAIADFILLAYYKSYDDKTLRYIDITLFRIN